MKSKILCLLLLIPIILVLITFTASKGISLPIDLVVENIILEHSQKEAVVLNEPFKLYAYKVPSNASGEIKWTTSDSDIAYVENGYLMTKKEGVVTVTASLEDGSLKRTFKAYVCAESDTPRYVIINNDLDTKNGLSEHYYFGEYDFYKGEKVSSSITLDVSVLPLNVSQEVEFVFSNDNCHYDEKSNKIVVDKAGLVNIKAVSKEDNKIFDEYSFNIVDDGVNVYSYDDLLNCTNRSSEGEIAVMQTSLESVENAYISKDVFYPNTKLFGLGEKNHLKFEYEIFESTYDTQYLKNNKENTELVRALNVKKDIYGNGFTVNLHNLTYPSKVESGTKRPITSNADIFRGPLEFVNVIGYAISGQDNIGVAVTKSNVTIQNLNLRNCNVVNDLTHLDYVGTVLEIMDGANNVTIKDSIVSNGRTVIRSFSNKGLFIDNCLLQYAREFIFKIGSNTVLKPEPNQIVPSNTDEKYAFLSPIPKKLANGEYESDSSATIKDTYFYKSGFFSIGLDTHFAGTVLYDGKYSSVDLSGQGVHTLCGTSLPSKLTLKGDVRLYDWKKGSELDSSTLITCTLPDLDVNKYFDVAQMIKNKAGNTNLMYDLGDDYAVHGGIAFFGGGRNLSKVSFDENLEPMYTYMAARIDDPAFGDGGKILINAAGYGEFKFYLYSKDTVNNLYMEVPSIDNLRR